MRKREKGKGKREKGKGERGKGKGKWEMGKGNRSRPLEKAFRPARHTGDRAARSRRPPPSLDVCVCFCVLCVLCFVCMCICVFCGCVF